MVIVDFASSLQPVKSYIEFVTGEQNRDNVREIHCRQRFLLSKDLRTCGRQWSMISQSGLVRRLLDIRVSHSSTLSYAQYSSTRYREWHHQIQLVHFPQKSTMTIHIVPDQLPVKVSKHSLAILGSRITLIGE